VSWLLNLLSGLVAVLISAALLHFGGTTSVPQDQVPSAASLPAAQPDSTGMADTPPGEDEASRHD